MFPVCFYPQAPGGKSSPVNVSHRAIFEHLRSTFELRRHLKMRREGLALCSQISTELLLHVVKAVPCPNNQASVLTVTKFGLCTCYIWATQQINCRSGARDE